MNVNIIDFDFLYIIRYHLSRGPKKSSKSTRPRTRAPIWHPDVCKIARHRSERLQMSILRKEGEGGGITRGN